MRQLVRPAQVFEPKLEGAVKHRSVSEVLSQAEDVLAKAGVFRPRADARMLVAHVLGIEVERISPATIVNDRLFDTLNQLVDRRARREPLRHIVGKAVLGGLEVKVGPGVFAPRVQSEALLAWGLDTIADLPEPVIVDLCTGSGAIALAAAHARPTATVYAIDLSVDALRWARRNADLRSTAGDTPVHLCIGDVRDRTLLEDINGAVDLVLCNPPYVPSGTELPPEFSKYHPQEAIYAGTDGLDVIRNVVATAARLLRPGGGVAIEHGHDQGDAVRHLLSAHGRFCGAAQRLDLAGLPCCTTARRAHAGSQSAGRGMQ